MRRSASADRKSLAPLRVRNEDNVESSSSRSGRNSLRKSGVQSTNLRSLSGNRISVGGRPSVGSRPSVGGGHKTMSQLSRPNSRLSRGSGMGVRNNGVPKDPRPVSDKGYQHKCIKNVFQFLTDKGYPHNITTKILQSPTNKDFFRIFEFMYGLIVPDYRNSPRPEEDIPKILKMLGYPFMISKSAMFAVGSPHMWPSILAALNWLVELIEYGISMSNQMNSIMFPREEDSFDTVSERQILHSYLVRTYKMFLDGRDDYAEEDEALRHSFKAKLEGATGSIDDLREENRILKMELEHLEQDKDKLKTEKQNLQLLKLDEERLITYLDELDTHKRQQEQQAKETKDMYNDLNNELEAENAKLLKMQLILEKQEFSQEDVERIKQKGRELQRQKDDIEKSIHALDQEIWQKEMSLSKTMDQVDAKCHAYNNLAYNLKLIPLSAENSSGIDFELKKLTFSDAEMSNFANLIKPALTIMKRQCQDSCMSKESTQMTLKERIEEINEVLSDLNNEIEMLENKNKRAEVELENKKKMYQSERENIQRSIDELETEKLSWNSAMLQSDQDIEKEMKKFEQWAAIEREKRRQKLHDYRVFFEKALGVFKEHMNNVQTTLSDAKKIPEILLEKTKDQAKQLGIE